MKRSMVALTFFGMSLWGEPLCQAQTPPAQPPEAAAALEDPASPVGGPASWPPLDKEIAAWYPPLPQRYVQADALFWNRVGTGCDQVLVVDQDAFLPGEGTLLTTGGLDFDYEPGLRLTFGWRPDPCQGCAWCSAWEVSYFGIFDWNASAVVAGENLTVPGLIGFIGNAFSGADEIRAAYDSELHNIELNCVKSCCFDCRTQIDFLCGFRFLTLQEDFSLIATDLLEEGTYDIATENYLYGVQIGGRLRRHYTRWSVELRGKAGVFVNDAQQRQVIRDFPDDFVLRGPTRGDGQSPAMLGEIGVTLIRHITNTWSIRGGYDALGIGGLALAPDQLDFGFGDDAGTGLQKTGWVFLHGAHVGLEARW